jgi:2,3-diketo-5-methylthio-1-phosphopentane phosphatase
MTAFHTFQSAPTLQDWRIVCDFDGTITPFDVTDAILAEFAHPSWEDVEHAWRVGRITARACMERQVGLLGACASALDGFLDNIPVTNGFKEFVGFCNARGLPLTVVSDGLDYAIKRILARHGVGDIPVIANRLRRRGEDGYRLEFPYGAEGCASGVCKCGVARALGGKILLIGDGRSDCCVAGASSLTLARQGKELQRRCETEDYPHRIFDTFFDVVTLLESLPGVHTEDACPPNPPMPPRAKPGSVTQPQHRPETRTAEICAA